MILSIMASVTVIGMQFLNGLILASPPQSKHMPDSLMPLTFQPGLTNGIFEIFQLHPLTFIKTTCIVIVNLIDNSYPERWRDWPFDASATD
jgi:hypothetical protein